MTDKLTPERRSENMRRIRGKDTKPEMAVRSLVHAMGYRYRLHKKGLPGKPDLVFGPRRKIVFVHGCFWHGHKDPNCAAGRRQPQSNQDYWLPKLARNRARDIDTEGELARLGWSVLIVWECDLRDRAKLTDGLRRFLDGSE